MPVRVDLSEHRAIALYLVTWGALSGIVGIAVGSACALFLAALAWAVKTQVDTPWLLYGLPFAGAAIALMYERLGKGSEAGNNLIVEEIHTPGGGVPLRMAPLILVGTIVTHLFGGSAGREGTAVQMGGSLADGFARLIPRLSAVDRRLLLMAGVSAGFSGVFGTPIAGTIFAMEVLMIGRLQSSAIVPCLFSAIVADQVCLAWGIDHTHYHVASVLGPVTGGSLAPFVIWVALQAVVAGAAFGLVSLIFSESIHGLQHLFREWIPWGVARPIIGGLMVIGLVWLTGTRDYLGLGVDSTNPEVVTIVRAFEPGGAHAWSWAAKLLFTVVTLASGFKGGEVTPLFFIGATLGNTLAVAFGAPIDLFAALGFLAVFAGATNTPIACTVMGVELFGGQYLVYYAIACTTAYLFSGHSGIYLSQRVAHPKGSTSATDPEETLRARRSKSPVFSRRVETKSLPPEDAV